MTDKQTHYPDTSFSPGSASPVSRQNPEHPDDMPPRKPDWLLILVAGFFLLTLLIAWLADIPSLFLPR